MTRYTREGLYTSCKYDKPISLCEKRGECNFCAGRLTHFMLFQKREDLREAHQPQEKRFDRTQDKSIIKK